MILASIMSLLIGSKHLLASDGVEGVRCDFGVKVRAPYA